MYNIIYNYTYIIVYIYYYTLILIFFNPPKKIEITNAHTLLYFI